MTENTISLAESRLKQEIHERAQTLEWTVEGLEDTLAMLELTKLERWVIDGKLNAMRLSIKMLKEKAGIVEEGASS